MNPVSKYHPYLPAYSLIAVILPGVLPLVGKLDLSVNAEEDLSDRHVDIAKELAAKQPFVFCIPV